MASIEGGDGGGHKKGPGVKKAKKLSTRVDMTPMVDLGFLLITFFIFTATLSEPKAMNLNMPKDPEKPDEEMKTKKSGALTIMLGKDNHVYYYEGELAEDGSNFKSTNFAEIRKVIMDKKKDVVSRYTGDPECERKTMAERKKNAEEARKSCQQQDFFVIIKPNDESTYQNAVDILDEMAINEVERYALVKISDSENSLIKATEGAGGK
jgi:biopolymer transport protein ExbD